MKAFYLKGSPTFQTTNEYLVPLVTGETLCQTKLGKIIIDPCSNISLQVYIFSFFVGILFLYANCKLPPLYSLESLNEIVTDNFLILPFLSPSLYGSSLLSQCQS